MKPILNLQSPLILRTDFSDDTVWRQICQILDQPTLDGYDEPMNYVNDPQYERLMVSKLFSIIPEPEDTELFEVFIVDTMTISDPTHPLLLVDVAGDPGYVKPGRSVRIPYDEVRDAAMQFSIGNLDISDYLPDDFDHDAYDEE